MKSLYESIINKSGVGLFKRIDDWMAANTNLQKSDYIVDEKGIIHLPEAALIFDYPAAKLDKLPPFIKFGDVGKGVYSIPRCRWKSFEGFPRLIGTYLKTPAGRFIMSTESDVVDYMPEIVKKDPHAKYPIELNFLNGIKRCEVDLPAETCISVEPQVTQEELDELFEILMPHTLGNVHVRVTVRHRDSSGHMKVEPIVYAINGKGVR